MAARLPGRLSRSHESRQRRCCAPPGRFSGFVTLASRDRSGDQTIAPIYAGRAIESAREELSTGSRPAERLQWPRLTAVRRCRHASVSSSTGRDGSTAARTSSRRSGHVLPGCSSDCRSSRSRSARPSQFRRRRRRCFVKAAVTTGRLLSCIAQVGARLQRRRPLRPLPMRSPCRETRSRCCGCGDRGWLRVVAGRCRELCLGVGRAALGRVPPATTRDQGEADDQRYQQHQPRDP